MVEYITISDICALLDISRRTLERMRKSDSTSCGCLRNTDGEIVTFPSPDFIIGRSPRWEKNKMLTFLNSLSNK